MQLQVPIRTDVSCHMRTANEPGDGWIDGAKGEQVLNYVVKKGNLEFLVCKQAVNHDGDELVDKGRPLKRKMVYVEYMDDSFIEDKRQC
ncbi:hypothetical protein Tco_0951615 [Tanacetum coccineum]|uniref:Uncharacterized protein n=1 Tax=Tanacetum coccineum TaxID=301880 RepID=A0ABQ5DUN3_9ASTR